MQYDNVALKEMYTQCVYYAFETDDVVILKKILSYSLEEEQFTRYFESIPKEIKEKFRIEYDVQSGIALEKAVNGGQEEMEKIGGSLSLVYKVNKAIDLLRIKYKSQPLYAPYWRKNSDGTRSMILSCGGHL